MESSQIPPEVSGLSSQLPLDDDLSQSSGKMHTNADILFEIPNPKDVNYTPLLMDAPIPASIFLPNQVNISKSLLSIFLLFFPDTLLEIIVKNTNEYARIHRPPIPPDRLKIKRRPWRDTCIPELKVFIGVLIYMGVHPEPNLNCYWRDKHPLHIIPRYISQNRFEQLKRYLHIAPWDSGTLYPAQESTNENKEPDIELGQVWWHKVEPVLRHIRMVSSTYYTPSSNISIDECMVRCEGRSAHTFKMPNKPIPEGYKLFVLADQGYIYTFTPASRTKGLDEVSSYKGLSRTGSMVLHLAKQLPQHGYIYRIYLDNYFTTIPLFEELRIIKIGAAGTTRPHAQGNQWPPLLKRLKDISKKVPYNTICAIPVGNVLCLGWQDNNMVFGLTTIHTVNQPTDLIERMRKRPRKTSTNAAIVRPVFGDSHRKVIAIPRFIDEYNHHMGGVDIANQHRAAYEVHQRALRSWWPLWAWSIDVAIVNAFKMQSILLKQEGLQANTHLKFREELYEGLFQFSRWIPSSVNKRRLDSDFPWCRFDPLLNHDEVRYPPGDRYSCIWCLTMNKKRPKGENGKQIRAGRTQWGCKGCQQPLCRKDSGRPCWVNFHTILDQDLEEYFYSG